MTILVFLTDLKMELKMASSGGGAKKSEVALIVGGGPGISASCARLFRREGMTVAVAARTPDKTVLKEL